MRTAVCLFALLFLAACGTTDPAGNDPVQIPDTGGVDQDADATDTAEPDGGDVGPDGHVVDECGEGNICVWGTCEGKTALNSCAELGTCCAGDVASCGEIDEEPACFCDEACVELGDCCSDACSACTELAPNLAFCPDDAPAQDCDMCTAKECGYCAGCADSGACDDPGEDCAQEGEVRCSPEEDGLVEQCTQLDGCRRWLANTYCETLNFCTDEPDVCEAGECVPASDPNAICDTPEDPCTESLCEPSTGACSDNPIPEFEPCEDGNVCTLNDVCISGNCVGNDTGPQQGVYEEESVHCKDGAYSPILYVDLAGGGSSVMDGFACDGMDEGYQGTEKSFVLYNPYDWDFTITLNVELSAPEDAGFDYVDVFVLSEDPGVCWPSACVNSAMMDDNGHISMDVELAANASWILVLDGREGYQGEVRLSASCPSLEVEGFCGDETDDDFDGLEDCADTDCADSPLCEFELACDDGGDNDGDGLIDCADPDCAGDDACDAELVCDDGEDDDGDGLIDCADPDCADYPDCGVPDVCLDAIPVGCGQTLTDQDLLTLGSMWFTDEEFVGCGGLAGSKITYGTHPAMIYNVEADVGCTVSQVTIDTGDISYYDMYAVGPGCNGDSCLDANFWTSSVDVNADQAWVVVAMDDANPEALAVPFDITVGCICQ